MAQKLLIVFSIIFGMASLGCSSVMVTNILKKIIGHLENEVFDIGRSCDLILVDEFMVPFDLQDNDNVVITINRSDISRGSKTAGNIRFMVDRGSYCIILLTDHFEGLSFPIVEHILEVIPSSGVVMVSKDTANATTNLNETNLRQVLHVNLDTQEEAIAVKMFCPNTTKNKQWIKVDTYWPFLSEEPLYPLFLDAATLCRHPMEGKNVSVLFSVVRGFLYPAADRKDNIDGLAIAMLRLVAKQLKFNAIVSPDTYGMQDPYTRQWNGMAGKLMNREAHIAIGGTAINLPHASVVGTTTSYFLFDLHWCTRRPVALSSIDNVIKVFPNEVWLLYIVTLLGFSISFSAFYHIYGLEPFKGFDLQGPLTMRLDFILLTFTNFQEPDPLPWFPRLSGGRLIVLMWSVFAFFLSACYNSNLRAQLMHVTYEDAVETASDVVRRQQAVYLSEILRYAFSQWEVPADFTAAVELAVERNSVIPLAENNGTFPDYVYEDVLQNGAIFVSSPVSIAYSFLSDKRLGIPHLYTSRDKYYSTNMAFWIQKNVPWQKDFDNILSRLVEAGIPDKIVNGPLSIAALTIPKRGERVETVEPVTIEKFLLILSFLTASLIVAACVFAGEILTDKRRNQTLRS